ncbi:hypothetical protein OBA47_01205 [bacterium]|nr:hypothetical protein [bacterium]
MVICAYLTFICLYRIQNEHIDGGIGDELGQYTMAIKGIWQKSICPKLKTYNAISGYYCYPLAFSWLCGQAGKNILLQKIFRNIDASNGLFPSLEDEKAVELKTSILILKLLSGLIFPLTIQAILISTCLHLGNYSLISLIIGIGSSLIADSIFTAKRYSISTRNVGYFLYLVFAISLLKCMIIGPANIEIFTFANLELSTSLFSVSLLIHQCSQRSSQTFIVLLGSACIVIPELRSELVIIYLTAQLVLLQLPFTNYSEFIRSHFYNRIHDSEWSTRLYGHFRYGFSQFLSGAQLKTFKEDFFKFKYLETHMNGEAYYKSNWFALFGVHRVYIYMALILLSVGNVSDNILLPVKIIMLSTIVPSILCFFRPFQGYGSLEVYVWSNIPLGYIACLPFLINSLNTNENLFIASIILLETICIALKGLLFRVRRICPIELNPINIIARSDYLDATASSFGASIHMNNLTKFIESLSQGQAAFSVNGLEVSIMALEMHPQSFVEVLTIYINGISRCKVKLKPAFVQLDNINYGYFQDYIQFFVNPNKIANIIKPDILLMDLSRPTSRNILNSYLKYKAYKVIFKSGPLVLLKMSHKIQRSSD